MTPTLSRTVRIRAGATGSSRKRQRLMADSESVEEEEEGVEIDGECMERTAVFRSACIQLNMGPKTIGYWW